MLLWAHYGVMGCQRGSEDNRGEGANCPGCGHEGGLLPSQGAAHTGKSQGPGPCSTRADVALGGDGVWWGPLADGMWSNGLIRALVRPPSPHSRWTRTLPSLLPIRSTWATNQANRTFPGAPAPPCPPLPTWEPPPAHQGTAPPGESFPGRLLEEDLELHAEFQTQRPKDQGAANCGLLLFPARSSPAACPSGPSFGPPPPGSPPYASSSAEFFVF